MSSIYVAQPFYITPTKLKFNKTSIKIIASKWYVKFSDGSSKVYFITVHENRVVQMTDSNSHVKLSQSDDAIPVKDKKNKNTLYYVSLPLLLKEINRDIMLIISDHLILSQSLEELMLLKGYTPPKSYYEPPKGSSAIFRNPIPSLDVRDESKTDEPTIESKLKTQQKCSLINRVRSSTCALAMMISIIIAFVTAIIGTEKFK